MTIETRLKRLEAITSNKRIIQVWRETDETEAEAIKRWELDNNTKIRPGEKVSFISWLK